MIKNKFLTKLVVGLLFLTMANVVLAKEDKLFQNQLLSGIDEIKVYIKSVEAEARENKVLQPGVESWLASQIQWLTDERLKVVATADKDQLRSEAQRLAKRWSKLRIQLKALKLLVGWHQSLEILNRLKDIQSKLELSNRVSLKNKLEIASDKLETVQISLNAMIRNGGSQDDWQRDLNLLREAIRYEKYAVEEIKQVGKLN